MVSSDMWIGTWSVLGPRDCGLVLHFVKRPAEWLEHHMLSGLVQFPVENACKVGICGGSAMCRSKWVISSMSGCIMASDDVRWAFSSDSHQGW